MVSHFVQTSWFGGNRFISSTSSAKSVSNDGSGNVRVLKKKFTQNDISLVEETNRFIELGRFLGYDTG